MRPQATYKKARIRALRRLPARHGRQATLRFLARVDAEVRAHRITEGAATKALLQLVDDGSVSAPATPRPGPGWSNYDPFAIVDSNRVAEWAEALPEEAPEDHLSALKPLVWELQHGPQYVDVLALVADEDVVPILRRDIDGLVAAPRPGPASGVPAAA